jgi:hypothetical protein
LYYFKAARLVRRMFKQYISLLPVRSITPASADICSIVM